MYAVMMKFDGATVDDTAGPSKSSQEKVKAIVMSPGELEAAHSIMIISGPFADSRMFFPRVVSIRNVMTLKSPRYDPK